MEYVTLAIPSMISGVSLLIIGYVAKKFGSLNDEFKAFRKEHTVLLESQRNQLKASIVEIYERALERGYVTPMELDTANRMADSYFALGGNHYIHAIIAQLNNMEVRGTEIPLY